MPSPTPHPDRPDPVAISPAIGPVPAIYVPQAPAEAGTADLVRRVALGVARRVARWGTPAHLSTVRKKGPMDFRLQVVTLSVGDIDQALAFYTDKIGFVLDVDYHPSSRFRVVQLTPPGSACSIQLGTGLTDAPNGSARSTYLAVTDLNAARDELIARGVKVGDIRHKSPVEEWEGDWAPGPDPERRDYASLAGFADPDGNTWVLQEIGYRPPQAKP